MKENFSLKAEDLSPMLESMVKSINLALTDTEYRSRWKAILTSPKTGFLLFCLAAQEATEVIKTRNLH